MAGELICTLGAPSNGATIPHFMMSPSRQAYEQAMQVRNQCLLPDVTGQIRRCIDNNQPELYVLDYSSCETVWREIKRVMGYTESAIDAIWETIKTPSQTGAGYYSAVADTAILGKVATDLNRGGALKAVLRSYSSGNYIILRGYPGLRRIFNGTKHLQTNPKIVKMGIGKLGAQKLVKSGGVLTIALLTIVNVADFVIRDDATLTQLIGNLGVDIAKAAISAGIGFVAGTVAAGMTALALGPLAVAIAFGVGSAMLLDWLDSKYDIKAKVVEVVGYIADQFMDFFSRPEIVVVISEEQLMAEKRVYFEDSHRKALGRRTRQAYRY